MESSCNFYLSAENEMHAYLVQYTKSQNWFAFSTDVNSDTQESSVLTDVRLMLAVFLTALYMAEGLETGTLKYDLMQ